MTLFKIFCFFLYFSYRLLLRTSASTQTHTYSWTSAAACLEYRVDLSAGRLCMYRHANGPQVHFWFFCPSTCPSNHFLAVRPKIKKLFFLIFILESESSL
uniref:Secreted protein n=1 Tax=Oryzias latipes TaxID=8090 RepID=A0A3P9KB13_ORYLA